MSDANKALLNRLFDEINKGNIDAFDAIMDDNFVEHEVLPPGMPATREGVKALFHMMRGAFPDLQMVAEHMVAEGDMVSAFVRMTGTHRGELMGLPATGKPVSINISDLMRMQDGRIAEHWGVMDMAALMQQIGAGSP